MKKDHQIEKWNSTPSHHFEKHCQNILHLYVRPSYMLTFFLYTLFLSLTDDNSPSSVYNCQRNALPYLLLLFTKSTSFCCRIVYQFSYFYELVFSISQVFISWFDSSWTLYHNYRWTNGFWNSIYYDVNYFPLDCRKPLEVSHLSIWFITLMD